MNNVMSRISLKDSLIRPSNVTAYAALDVISEVTTNDHFTFGKDGKRIVFPNEDQTGVIRSARLHSSAAQGTLPDIDLWLFRADIANVADNSAFAPTDAEALTLIGILNFSNFVAGGANSVATLTDLYQQFHLTDPQFIYGQMVVQNVYTPVSAEAFTCELDIERFGY